MLLGPLALDRDGTPVPALPHKAQDLLVMVLVSPERAVLREVAAEGLWPDAPAAVSRKAMRQALWQLHRAVDGEDEAVERLLLTEGDAIRVNPARELWVDASDFVRVAQDVQVADLDEAGADELAAWSRAADLYRGSLHAGCYEAWCAVPRVRLEDRALSLLDALSRAYERRRADEQAIGWAQRLLDIEPAHERTHRRLMRLFAARGDRTRALRQLEECRRTLAVSLGIAPDHRTEALGRAITVDELPAPAVPDDTADGGRPDPSPRPTVVPAGVPHPARGPAGRSGRPGRGVPAGGSRRSTRSSASPAGAEGRSAWGTLAGELAELRRAVDGLEAGPIRARGSRA